MTTPEDDLMNQATAPAPEREAISIKIDQPVRRPDAAGEAGDAGVAAETTPVIELRDLSFHYGSFRAVKDVRISIPPQRITALIGPSGCC